LQDRLYTSGFLVRDSQISTETQLS
jgi:hypothetical protein